MLYEQNVKDKLCHQQLRRPDLEIVQCQGLFLLERHSGTCSELFYYETLLKERLVGFDWYSTLELMNENLANYQ